MKSSNDTLDLRVRRTYKFLWDALMTLMTERDFESITVTDICERAMVHRTTFYKHYEDKYVLLYHGIQDELNALFEAVDLAAEESVETGKEVDNRIRLIAVFEHVRNHEGFYRLMLVGDGSSKFNMLLRNAMALHLEQNFQHGGKPMSLPVNLHAQVGAAAIVQMLIWWLENDCHYTPSEIVQYIHEHFDLI